MEINEGDYVKTLAMKKELKHGVMSAKHILIEEKGCQGLVQE